jgi:hypothetical protein
MNHPIHPARRGAGRIVLSILSILTLTGCTVEVQKTDILRPIESKLTAYRAVEIPPPINQKAAALKVSTDLQDKMLFQVAVLGKFRRVAPSLNTDQAVLVMQTTILKADSGSAFLRWWSSIIDFGGAMYESYAKKKLGNISGSIGDGFLVVDIRFVDKQTKEEIGQITIKGLSDDPDSFRSAEDRIVESLVNYVKTQL